VLTGGFAAGDGLPGGALPVLGAVVVAAGAAAVVAAYARFVREGAPGNALVVGGLYRHVRNPMYVAVTGAIVGQALLFGQLWLVAYAAAFLAVTAAFVRGYEEPTLARQFPHDYPEYRDAVPGWWPRLHPWTGSTR
jgi:protein-S-isoprenylcysteine O-methyltransferase Ste14